MADADKIRELRRKRILENSRSRLSKILGVPDEDGNPQLEPTIDGFDGFSVDTAYEPTNSFAGDVDAIYAQPATSMDQLASSDVVHTDTTKNQQTRRRVRISDETITYAPEPDFSVFNMFAGLCTKGVVNPFTYEVCGRGVMAVLVGIAVRLSLLLGIMTWHSNVLSLFFVYECLYELWAASYETITSNPTCSGASHILPVIRGQTRLRNALYFFVKYAICDFVMFLTGFTLTHLCLYKDVVY